MPNEDTHADLLLIHHMIEGDWGEVARLAKVLDEQDAGGIDPSELQVFDCNSTTES